MEPLYLYELKWINLCSINEQRRIKMRLLKTLLIVLTSLVLIISLTTNVSGLGVGDRMPILSEASHIIVGIEGWTRGPCNGAKDEQAGITVFLEGINDGHYLVAAFLPNSAEPFGIYDAEDKILYLDSNMDGIIDGTKTEVGYVCEDAP
jgi:hypothetical protein